MNSTGLLSAAGDPRLSVRPLGAEVPRLPQDTDVPGTLAPMRRTAGIGRKTPARVPTAPGTAPPGDPTLLHPPPGPGLTPGARRCGGERSPPAFRLRVQLPPPQQDRVKMVGGRRAGGRGVLGEGDRGCPCRAPTGPLSAASSAAPGTAGLGSAASRGARGRGRNSPGREGAQEGRDGAGGEVTPPLASLRARGQGKKLPARRPRPPPRSALGAGPPAAAGGRGAPRGAAVGRGAAAAAQLLHRCRLPPSAVGAGRGGGGRDERNRRCD